MVLIWREGCCSGCCVRDVRIDAGVDQRVRGSCVHIILSLSLSLSLSLRMRIDAGAVVVVHG